MCVCLCVCVCVCVCDMPVSFSLSTLVSTKLSTVKTLSTWPAYSLITKAKLRKGGCSAFFDVCIQLYESSFMNDLILNFPACEGKNNRSFKHFLL